MTFTTINDAINYIADVLNLDTDGARWVYDNTDCPDWDDMQFAGYDFLADQKLGKTPNEFI
jgi:hypothetical protein